MYQVRFGPCEGAAVGEWVAMSLLVGVLLFVAAHYLRKAVRTLRQTTPAFEMLPDERRYLRRRAWGQIVNSALMVVLAAMLAGLYVGGLPARADAIGELRKQEGSDGQMRKATEEERDFGRFMIAYVMVMLLVLGTVLTLAGVDFFATRRYALTQLRKINTDRRAMLERQITRWREERDGPSLN